MTGNHESKAWDYFIESVCVVGAIAYLLLQFYYSSVYKIGVPTLLTHIFTMVLIFAGGTLLQLFPEHLNVGCPDAVVGKVRLYAVRMVRMIKLVLVMGMLVPSIGDVYKTVIDGAYSLIIVVLIILIGVYYLYHIWKHNKNSSHK